MNFDIEKRRKELKLTLEQVGNFVGVSKSTVKKWETGYIENMKRDKIALLAEILQVSPLEIMGIESNNDKMIITGRTGIGKSSWLEKSSSKLEELENVVSWHRDGKTTVKQLTKEEMKLFEKMMEAMGDDAPDYL